jgi:amino acid transporter
MFFALCFVATCVDPTGAAMKSDPDNGFYTLAALVGGEWFGVACVVAVALSLGLFSSLAAQTAIARVLYTMGRTGALPAWIGTLSGPDHQPRRAILSVSVFSLVVLVPFLFLDMDLVAKFSNFGAIATYCILDVCVVAARFHSAEKGSVFRELVVPIVGFVFCAVILLSLGTVSLAVGFGWMALGTVYYVVKTRVFKRSVSME